MLQYDYDYTERESFYKLMIHKKPLRLLHSTETYNYQIINVIAYSRRLGPARTKDYGLGSGFFLSVNRGKPPSLLMMFTTPRIS